MVTSSFLRDSYGNEREWLDESLVVIRGSGDMARQSVDSWATLILKLVEDYPTEQPLFLLIDLSSPKQGVTPYATHKTQEVYQNITQKHHLFVAVLLRDNLTNQLVKILLNQFPTQTKFHSQAFTIYDQALQWLQHQRDTSIKGSSL